MIEKALYFDSIGSFLSVDKAMYKGEKRKDSVTIRNTNNESMFSMYSKWKKEDESFYQITINEYQKFMTLWEAGVLPKGTIITFEIILNLPYEKYK